jgi:hypothetical protein
MNRKKITIRGIEGELWRLVMEHRHDQQVMVAAILNEALSDYFGLSDDEND